MMMFLKGFSGTWYYSMLRFIFIFSYIIPISIRVNLDLGKAFYAWCIHRDPQIPGTIVRCSTISEELGRISYLLSDKTGTLTQNKMVFKKLHLGTISYGQDSFDAINSTLKDFYPSQDGSSPSRGQNNAYMGKVRRTENSRIFDAVHALALCHNVTPVYSDDNKLDTDSVETMETDVQRYLCLFSSSP